MNNEKEYLVYVYTNKINNKKYVGLTSKSIKERARGNGKGYKSCGHFWHAINKYGWNNFQCEIIKNHLTEQEACELEKQMIQQLNTLDQDYGYNISEGGDKGCLKTGARHHMFGKHWSEEELEKIRIGKRNAHPVLSNEGRQKLRETMLKYKLDTSKQVIDLDHNIVYPSIAEASRQTGTDESTISDICHGRRQRPKTHWAFISDYTKA